MSTKSISVIVMPDTAEADSRSGPHHGHYVAMVKSAGRWVMCDDENIEPIDEKDIYRYFGDYPSGAGYVLFYQAVDLDLKDLGMKNPPKPATPVAESRRTVPTSLVVDEPQVNGNGAANTNGAPNLMDVEEEHEEAHSHSQAQPQVGALPPVVVPVTPTAAKPQSPSSPNAEPIAPPIVPPATTPAVSTPPVSAAPRTQSPVTNGIRPASSSQTVVDRQVGFTPTSTQVPSIRTDASSTTSKEKEGSTWLSKMTGKSEDKDSKRQSLSVAPSAPTRSVSNSGTTSTKSPISPAAPPSAKNGLSPNHTSGPAPTAPRVIATPARDQSNNAMSSSVISNFSQSSSAGSSAQPPSSNASAPPSSYTQQSSLGRKPSASGRERTVSSGSQSGYTGGGGLGRSLSKMSGKFKLGLGGKKKDREGGIEEEDQKKSERKGLLG